MAAAGGGFPDLAHTPGVVNAEAEKRTDANLGAVVGASVASKHGGCGFGRDVGQPR